MEARIERDYLFRQGYVIRIKAVTVYLSLLQFQKGGVADSVRVCAGSQVVQSPNLDEFLQAL